jgi:hypothetical protein
MKILEQCKLLLICTYTAWDTLNVTDMSFMFGITPEFNNGGSPSIGNGIHLKLLICLSMFYSAPVFNQNIGTKVVTVNGITYTAWDTLNGQI